MRYFKRFFHSLYPILALLLIAYACSAPSGKKADITDSVSDHYNAGRFEKALANIDSKHQNGNGKKHRYFTDSIKDYIQRYKKEYPWEINDILALLNEKGIKATQKETERWEAKGQLEYMVIDGQKKYFKSAVRNLLLLNDSLRLVTGSSGLNDESLISFCLQHTRQIIDAAVNEPGSMPRLPVTHHIHYTTTLTENTLPEGKTISMWMPFALRDHARQREVRLLGTNPEKFIISPNDQIHQSVFLSQETRKYTPVVFEIESEYTSYAQYFNPAILKDIPFTQIPDSILPYLHERSPHIMFSDEIRELADELTTPEMTPYQMARSFYYWINDNIPWASAVEYGLIRNIPEYTLQHMHGDCGMQTLLFMALCRYKGIPARWQSGWMLHPENVNLHDWCEVWYHGAGWVPVDVSFKLQNSDNILHKEFYISGIDAYRLIVNTGYGHDFYPQKKHPRSEPWDFQRGEMEWEKANLYFDAWKRKMNAQYTVQ